MEKRNGGLKGKAKTGKMNFGRLDKQIKEEKEMAELLNRKYLTYVLLTKEKREIVKHLQTFANLN